MKSRNQSGDPDPRGGGGWERPRPQHNTARHPPPPTERESAASITGPEEQAGVNDVETLLKRRLRNKQEVPTRPTGGHIGNSIRSTIQSAYKADIKAQRDSSPRAGCSSYNREADICHYP